MPDEKDIHRLPRQYIINVLYTLIGDQLKDFVNIHIKARNDEVAVNRNLIIDMDPEIAQAFQRSVNISSMLNDKKFCLHDLFNIGFERLLMFVCI